MTTLLGTAVDRLEPLPVEPGAGRYAAAVRSSVLFVCVGNVCRSPLAEHLLRQRLDEAGVAEQFEVASAGVRAVHGSAIHPESARTLAALGGDATGFVARQLQPPYALSADLVLTATRRLRSHVLEEAPRALRRTFTIREFATLAASVQDGARDLEELVARCAEARGTVRPDDYDVPDPIGRGPEVFDGVADLLDREVGRVAEILLAVTPTS